jgi:predicted RNA-binding Zn ribbon-like protein
MAEIASIAVLPLVGGHPALDFANTLGQHPGGAPNEHLTDYARLVAWSGRLALLSRAEAQALRRRAADAPEEAQRTLLAARELRSAIYDVIAAHAAGAPVSRDALARLNRYLVRANAHTAVSATRAGFGWDWNGAPDALDRVLWPLARAAAELLTGAQLARVRRCAGEDCRWLFLDTSKNHSRRWCSMSDCGNRAKVRRFRRLSGKAGTAT